jgi:hypothetical protein
MPPKHGRRFPVVHGAYMSTARLQARAAPGASSRKPLFGGTRA